MQHVMGTIVTIVKLCIHSFIHAVVSYDRPIASSEAVLHRMRLD